MAFALDYVRARLRFLDDDIAAAVAQAAAGAPTSDVEYRALVGYIRGLRRARDIIVEPFNADERVDLIRPS